jgi:hypothetical protein
MQTLHVMPDTQGNWCVVDEELGVPFAHAETILFHDRYHRMHRLVVAERRESPR